MKAIRKSRAAFLALSLLASISLPLSAGTALAQSTAQVKITGIFPPTCTTVDIEGTVTGTFASPLIVRYGPPSSDLGKFATVTMEGDDFTASVSGLVPDSAPYQYAIFDSNSPQRTLFVGSFNAAGPTGDCAPDGVTGSAKATVTPHDTYADVYVTVSDSYKQTSLAIKYGTSATALSTVKTAMWNGTQFYGGLSPLKVNTAYYFQAFGNDGKALMTTPATFTTTDSDAASVGGTVTSLGISGIKQTEVTVYGSVAKTTSAIQILIDKTGKGTFDSSTTPKIESNRTFTFKITGLSPGNVYHIVAAKAGDANTRLSNVQAFATSPVYVTSYISELKDTSAVVAAQISPGSVNPTVYYGTDIRTLSAKAAMHIDPFDLGTVTAPLPSLTASTGYYYAIGSGDGKTFYMNPAPFVTLAASPKGTPVVPTIVGGTGGKPISYTLKGLVTCGQDGPLVPAHGRQACGFKQFMELISNIIDFLLLFVAPIIATVLILYHGLMILTSGGNAEKLSAAKGALTKVVVGFALACGAWLIVKFVLVNLGVDTTVFPVFY